MTEKLKVGILISGSGTNMQAIARACDYKAIDADVVFVGSDNPGAKGLIWAAEQKVPTFVVDYNEIFKNISQYPQPSQNVIEEIMAKQKIFKPRDGADIFYEILRIAQKIKKRIVAEEVLFHKVSGFSFDLLVLAGFMRNLTPYFIDRVNIYPQKPRIMNIHPAILPAFPGENGYEDTLNHGCKVGGCTVHFIDYGEDSGPIIGQRSFPILPSDTIEDIKKKGLQLEYQLYPECIQLFAEDRLRVVENKKGRKIVLITETHYHPCSIKPKERS